MNEDLVAIAKIVKTRGLRGEVIADILTDFPERFDETEDVTAVLQNGKRLELKIEDFRFQKGRILLQFAGFNSIEKAETLRNAEICIPETEAVALEEGEFFDWELENCSVETVEGEKLGVVKELMRTGGTEILVVKGETKEYLIPFAETICTEVDVENKLIKVDPPEGLLEF
ncbi:MAG TPA: ribosome maturation factor RimM [Pyrinomonadaceae bacterium]|nr:ribosome maturation factor RimM [Pyrinomonadaceae bacterium]